MTLETDLRAQQRPDPWLLRCARELHGWTQAELAAAMEPMSHQAMISRWEGYDAMISDGALLRVAAALGVMPGELCSDGPTWAANRKTNAAREKAGCASAREWLEVQS